MSDFSRFGTFLGATLGVVILAGVLGQQFFGEVGGADGALITRLKEAEHDGLRIVTDGGVLVGEKLQYQRIAVTLDASGERATVISTLDFTGEWRRGPLDVTKVSSLGLERAEYVRDAWSWRPVNSDAPRLFAIVQALDARALSLRSRSQQYQPRAWFIRSERDEVEVAEEYRLITQTPERPVDELAVKRLSLHDDGDGGFSFP